MELLIAPHWLDQILKLVHCFLQLLLVDFPLILIHSISYTCIIQNIFYNTILNSRRKKLTCVSAEIAKIASDQIKSRISSQPIVKQFFVTEKMYDWDCLYAPKMDQNEQIQIEKLTANHLINSLFMMNIIYF